MKFSKLHLSLFIFTILLSTSGYGQDLDQIISKHIEAHGGAEKFENVKALGIKGKFTSFSIENDYTALKTKDGSYYAEFNIGEQPVVESFHQGDGWTIDPWQDMDYARKINSNEVNAFLQKAEFLTPFFNYQKKGHQVKYLGKDTLDGIELYVLELTRMNQKKEIWYLNTETYLEYHYTSEWVDFAQSAPAEVFFDDFRSVNGLVFPFFIERIFWQRDRILQIETINTDPVVDESIFLMPSRNEMQKLEFLTGNWNVKAEVWSRRGNWFDLGNYSSNIDFHDANLIQEKIKYERFFPNENILYFTYNQTHNNYRLSVYNSISTEMNVYQGNFQDKDLIFNNASIRFNDNDEAAPIIFQYAFREIDNDRFVLEIHNSNDNGLNWNPQDKFTYTRLKD